MRCVRSLKYSILYSVFHVLHKLEQSLTSQPHSVCLRECLWRGVADIHVFLCHVSTVSVNDVTKVCLYILMLTISFGTEEGAWEIQSLVSRKHQLVWASWDAAHCLHTLVCLWELYRVTGTMRERVCTRVYIYIWTWDLKVTSLIQVFNVIIDVRRGRGRWVV